jgi:hypothetical protein
MQGRVLGSACTATFLRLLDGLCVEVGLLEFFGIPLLEGVTRVPDCCFSKRLQP